MSGFGVVELGSKTLQGSSVWSNPTIDGIRNTILECKFLQPMREYEDDRETRQRQLTFAVALSQSAVMAGRLFDLGYLSNDVIKIESKRAGDLYAGGHIGHPFSEHYILFHTWEEGGAVYLVVPDPDKPAGGKFIVTEFGCLMLQGTHRCLVIGDRITTQPGKVNGTDKMGWNGILSTSMLRDYAAELTPGETPENWGSNLVDPVAAAMLLLATDGVAVDRVVPSPKLNKARVKNGKPIIPPHWRVNTGPYVTALSARGKRTHGEGGQGHKASPVPHLRRGHIRHLHVRHGGGTTWVRDALVLVRDGKEMDTQLARSFYSLQREKGK